MTVPSNISNPKGVAIVKVVIRLLPAALLCLASYSFANPESSSQEPTATPPQTNTSAQAADAKSTTTSPTNPDAAKTSSNKVVLNDKTLTNAQVKDLLAQGYKPQGQGDTVVYCRREQVLGSHFESKICRSAAQILQERSDSKEFTENVQRTSVVPQGK